MNVSHKFRKKITAEFLPKFSYLLIFFITHNLFSQTNTNLTLLTPNGGEYWTTGSSPRITWKAVNILVIKIEISFDAGLSWTLISPAAIASSGSYDNWVIPSQVESDQCLIRISQYDNSNISDVSETFFRITADTSFHNIVVLGSSTAAGVGPSTTDSAWVWRYRNYLFEKNTTARVINLAVGGYTTYDIMPTGFVPPANRPTPKPGNNITKAITYSPDALIINLPSNDVNMGYSISEQLSNYDSILAVAGSNNVPVWITTTQPRNFSNAQILKQIEMRDSTFSRFGEKAIDFWTMIADSVGRINPLYDAGDGIHLNDKAHAILFSRVVEAKVFNPVGVSVEEEYFVIRNFELMQNYPNPFNPVTTIEYQLPVAAKVSIKLYDMLGSEVATLVNETKDSGFYKHQFDGSSLASGTYFFRIQANDFVQTKKMMLMK